MRDWWRKVKRFFDIKFEIRIIYTEEPETEPQKRVKTAWKTYSRFKRDNIGSDHE
jgi:hypothetical protein